MNGYILETTSLSKKFKNKYAVNKIEMHVKKGEIYGFIGRNGAGKTTFLKMIANLIHPTSGTIELFGSTDVKQNRDKIGILIENPGLYPHLSAKQNLKVKCLYMGIKNQKQKIKELLEFVGLEKVANKKAQNFSLGMKQRLGLALALVSDPELLLLDEPINGLDPQGIIEIRELLLKLQKEKNITIIISSHILEELGKIANRYGVIANGVLVKELTSEQLDDLSKTALVIKVKENPKTNAVLKSLEINNYQIDGEQIYIYETNKSNKEIFLAFINENLEISEIYSKKDGFEEMFIEMMGDANYV